MNQWDSNRVPEEAPPKTPEKSHKKSPSKGKEEVIDVEAQKYMGRWARLKGSNRREHAELEPSCSCKVPLKWSPTTKNLLFGSLLLTTATISMLKTLFVTVNAVIATQLSVSYAGATALTGAPLIFGACSGVLSRMLSKTIGKRGIYLVASVLMLVATMWNMHVYSNYAAFMASRVFQGIGWGAVEGLMAESISDVFQLHERQLRTQIVTFTSLFFLFGTPILGGYVSQNTEGFRNQIMIINVIQAFSVVSLILFAPETTFHHPHSLNTNRNSTSTFGVTTTTTIVSINRPPPSQMKLFLKTLKLSNEYSTKRFSVSEAIKPMKALGAPSTILTTLLTAPMFATAIGIAQNLSMLLTPIPTFLFPSRLGYIFILPFVFTTLFYPISVAISRRSPRSTPTTVVGFVLSIIGLLAFGIYTSEGLTLAGSTIVFSQTNDNMSLKIVSALFGCLVVGAVILSTAAEKLSLELVQGHRTLTEVFVGLWVIAMPAWVMMPASMPEGLKSTSIGLTVAGIIISSTVGAVLFTKREEILKMDARALGNDEKSAENQKWKLKESFMNV